MKITTIPHSGFSCAGVREFMLSHLVNPPEFTRKKTGCLEPLPHNGTVEITAMVEGNVIKIEVSKQDLVDMLTILP